MMSGIGVGVAGGTHQLWQKRVGITFPQLRARLRPVYDVLARIQYPATRRVYPEQH